MNFSQFLKNRQIEYRYSTIKEHFESLGGEPELGITLRYFQQIYNGDRPPTERIFNLIFERSRPSERKLIVISYFKSTLQTSSKESKLLKYLEGYLNPDAELDLESKFFSNDIKESLLNDNQLKLLIEDRLCLKLYNKILLYEKVKFDEIDPVTFSKLEKVKLARKATGFAIPGERFYKIPTYKNSDPYLSNLGTQLILKLVDTFIVKEGSDRQKTETYLILVPSSVAERILTQLGHFIEWAKNLADNPPNKSNVEETTPLFLSLFGKKLEKRDL